LNKQRIGVCLVTAFITPRRLGDVAAALEGVASVA